eukprot:TRINITY_DN10926_c0_g1_i1.p1 TRINITY_DN10926_c0_g1~~TRINITY_DN10926_c0_g1_i1.p1  ORF type:complete len:659 (+),score=156.22 TRINITY_DN10926_c0_g1_i1:99-2075(+)
MELPTDLPADRPPRPTTETKTPIEVFSSDPMIEDVRSLSDSSDQNDAQLKKFLWMSKLPIYFAAAQAILLTVLRWFAYLMFIKLFNLPVPDGRLLKALFFNGELSFNTLLTVNLVSVSFFTIFYALNTAVCYLLGEFTSSRIRLHLFNSFASLKKKPSNEVIATLRVEEEKEENSENETSRLLFNITTSAEAVRNYYCNFHSLFLFNIIRLALAMVTIYVCSWKVGFYMTGCLMVTYIGLPFQILFVNRRLTVFQEKTYLWFRKIADLCGGHILVSLHNMGVKEVALLEQDSFEIMKLAFPIAALQFVEKSIVVSLLNYVLPVLLVLQNSGALDTNVSLIFIIIRTTEDLHNAWDTIDNCFPPRGRYKAALEDVRKVTKQAFDLGMKFTKPEQLSGIARIIPTTLVAEDSKDVSEPAIIMDRVKLGYPDLVNPSTFRTILSVNVSIPAGKVIGIVGESGSGKTTFLKSLYGALEPWEGAVVCNGIDVYRNLESWLDRISVIPQDCYLFNRSIRDNITYGLKRRVTDAEIEEAAKLAAAHDFILRQPEGYDTMVLSGGANLSGGQRQRLHVARSFLRNASFIVMDEPTSALDSRIQNSLIESLRSVIKSGRLKAFVISTHRLELLKLCDVVYTVEHGELGCVESFAMERAETSHIDKVE